MTSRVVILGIDNNYWISIVLYILYYTYIHEYDEYMVYFFGGGVHNTLRNRSSGKTLIQVDRHVTWEKRKKK